MQNNVGDIKFWKERIEKSKIIRESVYRTTNKDWEEICKVHRHIIKQIVSGKVLDAGCVYGRSSEWIDDYTGVDFSPDFILEAQRRYPDKKFIMADLKLLPFEDKKFDWTICISIKRMIIREQGQEIWNEIEEELWRVSNNILYLEYEQPKVYEIKCNCSQ